MMKKSADAKPAMKPKGKAKAKGFAKGGGCEVKGRGAGKVV
jgi:hypothetical protein